VPADVVDPIKSQTNDPHPSNEAGGRGYGDQRKPEPHERVDLLVEEIDGQDTLDGVRVKATQPAQLEVAQSHPWESRLGRQRPSTVHQVNYERDAVQVVLGTEKQVENEQLDEQV